MATNYLEEEQLQKDIDANSVAALTALAAGGQEGLEAYQSAQDSAEAIRVAAEKDYGAMVEEGAAPEALLGELMADRDAIMSGVNTARELSKEGYQTGIAGIESALTGYRDTLKSQAGTYEQIGKDIIADAAARRAAALEAARQKRLKEARSALFRSLEVKKDFGEDMYDQYTKTIDNTKMAIDELPAPPEIKEILYDLTRADNPEMMAWMSQAFIGAVTELAPYRAIGAEAIMAYLDINYPQADAQSILSYLSSSALKDKIYYEGDSAEDLVDDGNPFDQ